MEQREGLRDKLLWFLRHKEFVECGTLQPRALLVYVTNGRQSPDRRWDNPKNAKNLQPVSARTLTARHRNRKCLFRRIREECRHAVSPLDLVKS